jgi:glycosyltransferase involved in cell wall biosynthesis
MAAALPDGRAVRSGIAVIKRLLTVAHSYVVGLNRRLAHEMAVQGRGRWEVTAIAPRQYAGDLRDVTFEPVPDEACRVESLPVHLDAIPQLMFYGRGLRAALRERWDVVHCWEEPYVAAGFQIARQSPPNARFVFATFQNIAKRYPPPFSWFERAVVARADGWIAFGGTVHETQAEQNGYSSLPSRVIPPGVDVDRFSPDAGARARVRSGLGWDETIPVVGFVGRFIEAKGIRLLLQVLPRLRTPWRALFVGDGPERARLEAFAATHRGSVAVATGVEHDGVADYLSAMDLLCAPSQTTSGWREQFGRMSIEAMACGVPVIGSDSGEIPHVVGDAGIIVGEKDIDGWVTAVTELLQDGARRRALADRGLARAREHYAWPVIARAHLDFFEELL